MDHLRALLEANATLRARSLGQPSPVPRSTWDRVVGPRIAARSEPYRLEHGVLLVRVASSAWANELSLLSEPIVEQLRAQGIAVTSVRFIVGEVSLSPRRTRGPAAVVPPPNAPIPALLAPLLDRVPSPALRDALAQAAAKSMALAQAATERFGRGRGPSARARTTATGPSGSGTGPSARPRSADRARESVLPPPDSPMDHARKADAQRPTDAPSLDDRDRAPSIERADEPQELDE